MTPFAKPFVDHTSNLQTTIFSLSPSASDSLHYTEIKKTDARAISADLLLPLFPPPIFLFLPSSSPPSSLHPEVRPRMPHKKAWKSFRGLQKRRQKEGGAGGRRPQGRYRDGGEGVRISGRRGEWGSRRLMSTFQGSPLPSSYYSRLCINYDLPAFQEWEQEENPLRRRRKGGRTRRRCVFGCRSG